MTNSISFWYIIYISLSLVLVVEPWASHMLGKCLTTKILSQVMSYFMSLLSHRQISFLCIYIFWTSYLNRTYIPEMKHLKKWGNGILVLVMSLDTAIDSKFWQCLKLIQPILRANQCVYVHFSHPKIFGSLSYYVDTKMPEMIHYVQKKFRSCHQL